MIISTMRQIVYKGVWTYNLRLFCGYLALCPYKASHVQRLWRLFPPALLLPKPPALCLCWQLRVWGYLTSRRFVSIFLQRSDSQSCPVQIKTFCLTGRMVRSARCTYLEPEFAVWAFPAFMYRHAHGFPKTAHHALPHVLFHPQSTSTVHPRAHTSTLEGHRNDWRVASYDHKWQSVSLARNTMSTGDVKRI